MNHSFEVVIEPEAMENLEEAFEWIKMRSPAAATRWMVGLLLAIENLATFPARCAIALESRFFHREIRHPLYGRQGHRYRVLFTIEGATD